MRIVELHTENFMGVEAVDVTPETDVIVVGGKNAQGKSSVLNSIIAALGGAKGLPDKPLRRGAENGNVRVRIARPEGDLIVERTFTENGSTLKVTSADGARYPKPQQLLDALVGAVGFDPHAFIRLDANKQAEQVRELVGLDFSEFDQQRSELYAERTAVNRSAKALEARLAAMKHYPEAPEEEVAVSSLVDEMQRRQSINRENDSIRYRASDESQACAKIESEINGLEEEIARLQKALEAKRGELAQQHEIADEWERKTGNLTYQNVDEIVNQIDSAEETNRQVRANRERAEHYRELQGSLEEASRLTKLIEQIDAEKQQQLQSAPWPVEGLGFDEHGVTYRGLPLSQASSAEQLRVSLAMGMALNPKLRVLIMAEGSLLDDDTMSVIRDMVTEHDFQLWIEKVSSDGKGCSLVIKEGRVAELVA